MTFDELKARLEAMSDDQVMLFNREYGGGGTGRKWLLDHFLSNVGDPKVEAKLCNFLQIPTEQERINKATFSAADAANMSAKHANEGNAIAHRANWISVVALVIAAIALIVSSLKK